MTYMYDVILNFTSNNYFDFFEWNKNDLLLNIKKVPIICIDENILYDFINCKIKVNDNFLKELDGKSIFLKKYKSQYNYCVILSSKEKSIGVCFDKNGNIIYKSSMLLDEEDEANKIALKLKKTYIKYKKYIIKKNYLLRCDLNKKKILLREIDNIYKNNEIDKLKYIYYELYNKELNDKEKIYHELLKNIDNIICKYDFFLDFIKTK